MLSLNQGRRKTLGSGSPIYSPFDILNRNEIFFRKGQLTLVVAAPGTGKSALTHSLLQRGNDAGNINTTLYLSADTDESTMWIRGAAIATGYDMSGIERQVREGTVSGWEAEVREATRHLEFTYNSSPSDEDVHRELAAYATKYGAYPEVVVMDNASNLYAGGSGDEYAALQDNCNFLHELARETRAAVITLAHATGEYVNGDKPIPRSGILGKIDKTPEMVLTLFRRGDYLHVCPVKNRTGKADPRAEWQLPLYADLARMHFQG